MTGEPLSDLPQRKTLTERHHELVMAMAQRPEPTSAKPSYKISQVKAVGGATVYEWDVHIPVCDEFPTADDAFDAAIRYAKVFQGEFGPSNGSEK